MNDSWRMKKMTQVKPIITEVTAIHPGPPAEGMSTFERLFFDACKPDSTIKAAATFTGNDACKKRHHSWKRRPPKPDDQIPFIYDCRICDATLATSYKLRVVKYRGDLSIKK